MAYSSAVNGTGTPDMLRSMGGRKSKRHSKRASRRK